MDSAFNTAPYSGYTTAQLREFIADPDANMITSEVMRREIERRERVAAGDFSVMTPGERLRTLYMPSARLSDIILR